MHGYAATVVGPKSFIEVNGHRAQVKAATKGAWQIADVYRYTSGVYRYTSGTIEHVVLVDLTDGLREFYVCPGEELRSDVLRRYEQFLTSVGGVRHRNPDTKHHAIYPENVQKWHNSWSRFA